jgi:quaternary ammonium compound-resistance protein SugE
MHWIYLLIASCLEVCWLYSLKFIDFRKIKSIEWGIFFSGQEYMKLLPVFSYVVFGVLNIIFFSLAMRKIPASTAFAVWVGVAMAATKLIDIMIFKQPYSLQQVFFILLILAGVVGLKVYSEA